jgi:hypothetical protein
VNIKNIRIISIYVSWSKLNPVLSLAPHLARSALCEFAEEVLTIKPINSLQELTYLELKNLDNYLLKEVTEVINKYNDFRRD